MLGAAKWLFENEGQTLQSLLVKNLVCNQTHVVCSFVSL